MAKKQTRRSISVSKVAFEEAQPVAEGAGVSLSQFTERALKREISSGSQPAPSVTIADVRAAFMAGLECAESGDVARFSSWSEAAQRYLLTAHDVMIVEGPLVEDHETPAAARGPYADLLRSPGAAQMVADHQTREAIGGIAAANWILHGTPDLARSSEPEVAVEDANLDDVRVEYDE